MAKKEAAPELLEFFVDKDACIGCVACAESFPDIFKMVGDKAVAYEKAQAGVVRPSKVLKTCPTDAIKLVGDTLTTTLTMVTNTLTTAVGDLNTLLTDVTTTVTDLTATIADVVNVLDGLLTSIVGGLGGTAGSTVGGATAIA